MDDVRLTLADVNPLRPMMHVLQRMNNLAILAASGAQAISAGSHEAD